MWRLTVPAQRLYARVWASRSAIHHSTSSPNVSSPLTSGGWSRPCRIRSSWTCISAFSRFASALVLAFNTRYRQRPRRFLNALYHLPAFENGSAMASSGFPWSMLRAGLDWGNCPGLGRRPFAASIGLDARGIEAQERTAGHSDDGQESSFRLLVHPRPTHAKVGCHFPRPPEATRGSPRSDWPTCSGAWALRINDGSGFVEVAV